MEDERLRRFHEEKDRFRRIDNPSPSSKSLTVQLPIRDRDNEEPSSREPRLNSGDKSLLALIRSTSPTLLYGVNNNRQ
jgi:hypothetical protein